MSTVFLNFFYFFIFREFLLRICILSSRLKRNIRETWRVIFVSRLCADLPGSCWCYFLQILLLIIHLSVSIYMDDHIRRPPAFLSGVR